jgi:hypothetical protein
MKKETINTCKYLDPQHISSEEKTMLEKCREVRILFQNQKREINLFLIR